MAYKLKLVSGVVRDAPLRASDFPKMTLSMTRLLTLFAAIILITAIFALPVQAQQHPQTTARNSPAYRAYQQRLRSMKRTRVVQRTPRFYNPRNAELERTRNHIRTRITRPYRTTPRFYGSVGAARASEHIRRRVRVRGTRISGAGPRRTMPRMYNSQQAARISQRLRNRSRGRMARPLRLSPRRIVPFFWR